MTENLFLKPPEFYKRNINPLAQYVEQTSFYLSKMTGKPIAECKNAIVSGIKDKKFPNQRDPIVTYFERDENQDRSKQQIPLSGYIREVVKNEEILVPTFTTYIPSKIRESLLVKFTDNNVKLRSKAKKAAHIAEADNRKDDFIMLNNEQANRKLYNNSMSGAFAAGGSIVNNPTGHNTLTSTIRIVSSMGNSSNEKIIMGNRHYHSSEVVLNNLISITSSLDKVELQAVIEKYNLKYPSVQDVLKCIRYSTDLYWNDPKAFKKIEDFVNVLDPIERAAFVYIGDLYHLKEFNNDFIRDFLVNLSKKVKKGTYDYLDSMSKEDLIKRIHKFDEQIVNYAHIVCMKELKGFGKDYEKIVIDDLLTLASTCLNIGNTVIQYKDLISAIFLTNNVPASTAVITTMIRRTVVLSDTDSTMFAVDDWVMWHRGKIVFDDEAYAFAGSIMFIATQCIAHCLAIFSANMGVAKDKLHMLAMKPEFLFPLHCQTSVAKHYYASIAVKEGNVYPKHKVEIKGVGLKNSAKPKDLIKSSQAKMAEIMDIIQSGGKISIVNELIRVSAIENKIKTSLLSGNVEYYNKNKIKEAEAYARGAEDSPYAHYTFWQTVFAPKYGNFEAPPFGAIKVPLTTINPSTLKEWVINIKDPELQARVKAWILSKNRKYIGTMYLSLQYVKSHGIPEELKPIVNFKKIALDLTSQDRMVLESLGYYPKVDWLISELGY